MDKTLVSRTVQQIIQNQNICGIETYAIIKQINGELQYHFLELKQTICQKMLKQFISEMEQKFIKSDFSLKNTSNVADNQKIHTMFFPGIIFFREYLLLKEKN